MTRAPHENGDFAARLAQNERYAQAYERSVLTATPMSGLAIVACMDARIDVTAALGLRVGDAHIIRNAGGLITDDVIRSLVVSQQLMGTHEIIVIEHTACGLHGVDEGDLRTRLAADLEVPAEDIGIDFGAFADLEANLRAQLEILRTHPLLRDVPVHGLIFDVATGRLREVA
jgi:carbonic anhydrase